MINIYVNVTYFQDFDNIENGYEFMRIWRSLKNDTDLEVYAQLLRSLDTNKLSSSLYNLVRCSTYVCNFYFIKNIVLGNELDGNMFSIILHCLEQHFCTSNDTELLNNFLTSLCQVKRFSIVNMFMSNEDKRGIFSQ